jgi:transcriptional regulator with GAF, ATPase, and Fis domain
MNIACWLQVFDGAAFERDRESLLAELVRHGIDTTPFRPEQPASPGICLFGHAGAAVSEFVRIASCNGQAHVIVVAGPDNADGAGNWDLLEAGASDVLAWSTPEQLATQLRARFERWLAVDRLLETTAVTGLVVARSAALRRTLRDVVEVAHFSSDTVLVLGESGTGKEVIARLIHLLDSRPDKRDLVVLDCSTVVPELSGSEFFGHERGAFTGAVTERHGAFALANGGTLFLDEVGELSLPLQAQLLRVIQERTYKRVGGNTWCRTTFRLVCATNRDLPELVRAGAFRADLYYRIAGSVCRLPPLRERLEDVIPLAEMFLRQAYPDAEVPKLDNAVRGYLMQRSYPGNVRDLQQVVSRLACRHAGDQTISIGYIPPDERPAGGAEQTEWLDAQFEHAIRRAVLFGGTLKDISRAAEDTAIRFVTSEEGGNLQRAARRLGVTDRALQLRRANQQSLSEASQQSPPGRRARHDEYLDVRRADRVRFPAIDFVGNSGGLPQPTHAAVGE